MKMKFQNVCNSRNVVCSSFSSPSCIFIGILKKYIPPGAAMLKHHRFVWSLWALYSVQFGTCVRMGVRCSPCWYLKKCSAHVWIAYQEISDLNWLLTMTDLCALLCPCTLALQLAQSQLYQTCASLIVLYIVFFFPFL